MPNDMIRKTVTYTNRAAAFILIAGLFTGCMTSAKGKYFGKTVPPANNVLRYISGSEPETLDPQLPDGQPEARIFMALYEGLVEYDPKTLQPIPAIAKSWEINPSVDEFIFHLRDNAKWSDGKPITARDFVYSLHRGFRPDTISRTAGLGYFIKYSEAFNAGRVFVKKNGVFLLDKDFGGPDKKSDPQFGPESDLNKFLHSPDRLTLAGDEKKRAEEIAANPSLASAVSGAEFVPVTADDIGVEAVDDHTLRITLRQSAPFFLGLLAHQFFRLVPEQSIEKWGKDWTRPEHIVTCGPFKIKTYKPYDTLVVERDPNYWDAGNVHLDGIEFYPIEDLSTMMNLYKTGSVDAMLNHSVPAGWIDEIRAYKDEYMDFPENSTSYYAMNMTKPPFNDIRVRRAFTMAVDQDALSEYRKVTKPLYDFVPSGIVPGYDKAVAKVRAESAAPGAKRQTFDAATARDLLGQAGFPVQKSGDGYSCPTFPTDHVSLTYNTGESNRAIAEFVQAQWKHNLGVTVPLKTMEFKTFLPFFKSLQYEGFAQFLWSGDYMDPYTFLGLEYGKDNEGGSGFYDPKYDKMLDDANSELDVDKRYEKLARAEAYLMTQLPAVPLTINATSWMKKPYVKGMYPNPGTLFPWKFVYIEHDPAKWDTNAENIMTESDPQVDQQLAVLTATQKDPAKQN